MDYKQTKVKKYLHSKINFIKLFNEIKLKIILTFTNVESFNKYCN